MHQHNLIKHLKELGDVKLVGVGIGAIKNNSVNVVCFPHEGDEIFQFILYGICAFSHCRSSSVFSLLILGS
jgi:hypothetical protein